VAAGSWFDALPPDLAGQVRLVVSNPPYVSASEWEQLDPVVRDFEPFGALVPGPTGLEAIEVLLDGARRWLAPGGSLVVELAPGQAAHVSNRATELGYVDPEVLHDLAGRRRMLVTRRPPR
jgi:release factor glutamine methyltransferase